MTHGRLPLNAFWRFTLVLASVLFFAWTGAVGAQSIVVMVNGEPITSYDVAQRQRFLALTSGLGDAMQVRLKSDKTKEDFQAYMQENRPQSKEEAQELQKKFVAKLQQEVMASASGAKRKEAIEQLIEERLMIQAAREQKIDVSDDRVNELLTRMAQGGGRKASLDEFLDSFRAQGVNPSTLRERIRAQTAWRDVVRRLYGSQVRASVPTSNDTPAESDSGTTVDVEVVKFAMPEKADQKLVASRLVEAETLRKKFKSCSDLAGLVKGLSSVTVQSVKKANLKDFRGEVKAALVKAKPGEMTPPIITAGGIESHAVCSKKVSVASADTEKKAGSEDKAQEQFQLYSRRHLRDLKERAFLKYPQSG
jgi:peptidyl-prolyl cis-trans isomerase SurA